MSICGKRLWTDVHDSVGLIEKITIKIARQVIERCGDFRTPNDAKSRPHDVTVFAIDRDAQPRECVSTTRGLSTRHVDTLLIAPQLQASAFGDADCTCAGMVSLTTTLERRCDQSGPER